MPSIMSDDERDEFLLQPHLGYLAIGRMNKGPLLQRYTDDFIHKLATDDFPGGHGADEVVVTITPENWRTEILP